ncbi:hypothetical protein PT974_10754 [Cladobotryum mycophilum]|uniref:Uncharacterized protein n=1 Tax=Cladobotryum mycophilum TaxID=491253 RepID=A0ABR0SAY0_9HYPO
MSWEKIKRPSRTTSGPSKNRARQSGGQSNKLVVHVLPDFEEPATSIPKPDMMKLKKELERRKRNHVSVWNLVAALGDCLNGTKNTHLREPDEFVKALESTRRSVHDDFEKLEKLQHALQRYDMAGCSTWHSWVPQTICQVAGISTTDPQVVFVKGQKGLRGDNNWEWLSRADFTVYCLLDQLLQKMGAIQDCSDTSSMSHASNIQNISDIATLLAPALYAISGRGNEPQVLPLLDSSIKQWKSTEDWVMIEGDEGE